MHFLIRTSNFFDRIVSAIGAVGAWLCIPLIAIIIFDVITRRFLVLGSTKLQELEWHIHAMLFFLCIGWAYLKHAHVRIELVHERLPRRWQIWIEFLGCLLFLIPYCLIVLNHGVDWWLKSWWINEMSDSATGLPYRWVIKFFLPFGFFVILLSAVTVCLRKAVQLFGPARLARTIDDIEADEAAPSDVEFIKAVVADDDRKGEP